MNYSITKLATMTIILMLACASIFANDKVNNNANTSDDLLVAQASDYYLYGTVAEHQSGGSGGAKRVIKEGIGVAGNPRLKIINLGASVNSSADDFAPTVTANGKTFYFVSNRPGSKLLPNGKISTDF